MKQYEDQGYTVLKERPYDDWKIKDIDYLRVSATNTGRLTHKQHEKCPGRAVLIGINFDGKAYIQDEYCTDATANGHVDSYSSSSGSSSPTVTPCRRRRPAKNAASCSPATKRAAPPSRFVGHLSGSFSSARWCQRAQSDM